MKRKNQDICAQVALVMFFCALTLYVYVLFTGTDSPAHTITFFIGVIAAFTGSAILAAFGRRGWIIWVGVLAAVLSIPFMIFAAYLVEMLAHT